jgi:hypothetical protein
LAPETELDRSSAALFAAPQTSQVDPLGSTRPGLKQVTQPPSSARTAQYSRPGRIKTQVLRLT